MRAKERTCLNDKLASMINRPLTCFDLGFFILPIMATFTAEVEVDISQFSDNDIVSFVKKKMAMNDGFSKHMKKSLSLEIPEFKISIQTLIDKQKLEFIQDNWDKITLDNLENCIK